MQISVERLRSWRWFLWCLVCRCVGVGWSSSLIVLVYQCKATRQTSSTKSLGFLSLTIKRKLWTNADTLHDRARGVDLVFFIFGQIFCCCGGHTVNKKKKKKFSIDKISLHFKEEKCFNYFFLCPIEELNEKNNDETWHDLITSL